MDLTTKSPENIHYMITEIKQKLKMVNDSALNAENFSNSSYDDVKDLYNFVIKKNSFSPNEMQAIVEELGNLRK
ncbi:hypothetical protein Q73_01120 [Bacillus coahuilensis m2-6]|uniref:UPF0435 protein Q75_01575 n=1 Tax=Bacillus coahuilensis p1.1.43 TaxID=1150625 RepID=A0A147KC22_9BACI|nr:DUF1128 domain-containing protein [Bacillus coahuilensis]KUP09020.1 hypothetical protein Q75_01575 [Bacillus coahuilensis p1.1.43]KUP09864.1 hypothetical protein Q73_01120 [Bacillus coahuilensis m2-6]